MKTEREFDPIRNVGDLRDVVSGIQAMHPDSLLLHRGQVNYYPTVRSGRARPDVTVPPDVELGWAAIISRIAPGGDRSDRFRSAMLQHYGVATDFLDVTADPEVAAWFACNQYSKKGPKLWIGNSFRRVSEVAYTPVSDGQGYLLVFVIPDKEALLASDTLFDLTGAAVFTRPSAQRGWLLYDRAPVRPDPNTYWRYTIPIRRDVFQPTHTLSDLFPPPTADPGYAALLSVPYVQIPTAWFPRSASSTPDESDDFNEDDVDSNESLSDQLDDFCLAQRIIEVPEYHDIDHKWQDMTIFEPHHMRVWPRWEFELGSMLPGLNANIRDATKVTLTPDALAAVERADDKVPFAWPQLESNSIFFTFAVLDHDKVIDHGPPYDGVWLVQDRDLVAETPMSANPDALCVHAGHVYLMIDGRLKRQDVENSCTCGSPETHDLRIQAMMRLHHLIASGRLALVPHPAGLPRWYYVF